MRLNEEVCVTGRGVVLTPHRHHHVQRYHEWMKSEELQRLTASEPLTLEEEYEMQKKWHLDENNSMCGDVNLFLNNPDDSTEAEIEIMIADSTHRQKGMGSEALYLTMAYGVENLNLQKYMAKIGMDNYKSLSLFTKKLGFTEISRSEVFQEVTFKLEVTPEVKSRLQEQAAHASSSTYKPKDKSG